MFKVAMTIKTKGKFPHVLQNKVHLDLQGDKTDLFNLQKELAEVKATANTEVNRNNLRLKDCDVIIEFID